ncbi:hypothetical protein [Sinomonas sp.]|jgi:hypothetical protein|uniref:hypothetical protein n=1 Tax=Sinomonas sp. TaxID=1914986 RepID=UPI002FE42769
MTPISSKSLAAAAVVSAIGLSLGSIGAMYIAGMFGLSASFAGQIVDAVTVGGWVLAVVMGLLSGGTAAVVIGTARWAISALGRRAAVA